MAATKLKKLSRFTDASSLLLFQRSSTTHILDMRE